MRAFAIEILNWNWFRHSPSFCRTASNEPNSNFVCVSVCICVFVHGACMCNYLSVCEILFRNLPADRHWHSGMAEN